jgi:ribosome-binding factor A
VQGKRSVRLGGQIQQEISDIISRKVKDPRLGFVTVTGIKMSPDLRYATVYITVMGADEDADRSLQCLESASKFIRHELGGRLHVRHVPELRFQVDEAALRGRRIEGILREIKNSDDRDPDNGEGLPEDS